MSRTIIISFSAVLKALTLFFDLKTNSNLDQFACDASDVIKSA